MDEDITFSDAITVNGDVHLILGNDNTMTASVGINIADGSTLYIYGQQGGNGTLTVNGTKGKRGLDGHIRGDGGVGGVGNAAISGNVVVNSGTVNLAGGNGGDGGKIRYRNHYGGNGGTGGVGIKGLLTVNGGSVNINGGNGGAGGSSVYGVKYYGKVGSAGAGIDGTITFAATTILLQESADGQTWSTLTSGSTSGKQYIRSVVPTMLTLYNDVSNEEAIANASVGGNTYNVTLADRTLTKDGTWNTLCLPFSLSEEQIASSPLAGATIKEMDSSTSLSSDGVLTLKFTNAQSIEAGKAYIVKWETTGENIVNPVFNGVTVKNDALTESLSGDGKVKFVGQYSPFAIDENNIHEILFIGSGNKIGYSKNPRSLKSCRAHFWVEPNGKSASARVINLDLGDGVTTRIDLVNAEEDSNSESGMYTLDGRKLQNEPTQKGVYIINGKKVVK